MPVEAKQVLEMYRAMLRIRAFEERVRTLSLKGQVPGLIHVYSGEEAVAAGVMAALRPDDYITSTHRGHGHVVAKGGDLKLMMAEIMGKATGYCKGKGGSMHIAAVERGVLGVNGIVGAGMPIGVGAAFACKYEGTDRVAVTFFGDGAANRGTFHESLNLASIWNLPIVFLCENNGFGMSVPQCRAMKLKKVSDRAAAYGVPGVTVDGNDVVAVNEAAKDAVARARAGDGPTLLECATWRHHGHFLGDPCRNVDPEENARWLAADPLLRCAELILRQQWVTAQELDALKTATDEEIEAAVEFGRKSPWPSPDDVLTAVFAD
jgi:acetoin:2,6-dichlorophenolindophenol oxidoreductase subunit alpha